jgi:gamma-glutamylcyclotransferase (GGCT)/AIG2-like uncharacterized protein YtfP
MRHLPVFVYGTLRRGQGNFGLLARATVAEFDAVALDHVLYAVGLPYAADRPGSTVTGELMVIDRAIYETALARLDRLEGFRSDTPERSHYVRVPRPVRYQDAAGRRRRRLAWIYHGGSEVLARLTEADVLPGGDWLAARAA